MAADGLGEQMEAFLRSLLAGELGMHPDEVSATVSLERYGVESVLVVRLTQQLEERFGPLPKTLFFEMQTLRELAAYFTEHHGPAVAVLLAPEADRRDQPARKTEAPRRRPGAAGRTMPGPGGRSRFLPSARSPAPAAASASGDRPAPGLDPAAPIAIIGVSGRYPQAQDLAAFWRNLRDGRDCIGEIPAGRWDWRTDFDPEIGRVGTSYTKWGGFIEEIDRFDARFFHIAPKEAEVTDPQERLFLETVYHTLEDAGYTSATLDPEGRRVGVFVGVMWGQYQLYGATRPDLMPLSAYWGVANRVSYVFNFKGPSLAVDTACSSSLTAVHLACESLRRGECRVAIAGGVNLTLHPDKYIILSQSRFASTDGRCRSFGAGGDGYVPGEGVGALMLKPLAQARADGDVLHGVILGSALNHGGKTTGYTVPNPDAQADTIRRALGQARLDPGTISYLEAHGTGTALGDPVEIRGLTKVFAAGRRADAPPCAIGSVKSNIGHLESAAGVAGITKVLLQMRHGELVPSLHADTLNPNLELDNTPFRLQRRLGAWPATPGQPRRAGVSSFGAGGANAHIILEEPPAARRTAGETPNLFVVSAASEAQRDQLVKDLLAVLRTQATVLKQRSGSTDIQECPLASVLYTLQVGRAALRHRLAAIVDTPARLIERLDLHGRGQGPVDGVFVGEVPEGTGAGSSGVGDALKRHDWAALARLWTAGAEIDWHRLYAGGPTPSRVSLPAYPFDRQRYWVKEGRRPPGREGAADTPGHLHPLVQVNSSTFKEQRYTSQFARDQFFLRDHRFNGVAILPGAIQLEIARIAGTLAGERTVHGVDELVWLQPAAADGATLTVAIALYPDADGADFEVRRLDGPADPAPSVCCQGRLVMGEGGAAAASGDPVDLAVIRARCPNRLDTEALYHRLQEVGLDYGPAFRGLEEAFHSTEELLARLVLPDSVDLAFRNACPLHPVLIDGALQSVAALLAAPDGFHLPSGIGALRFAVDALPDRLWVHGRFAPGHAPDQPLFDLELIDDGGRPLVRVSRFALRAVPRLAAARGDRATSPTQAVPSDGAATVYRARLEAWLTECLAAETGEAVAQIALKEPLETYGLDSVMVLELTRTLESHFGPLSKTLFFEVRTLADLADYFLVSYANEVAALFGGTSATGPADGPAAAANLPPAPVRAVTRPRFAAGSGSRPSRSGDAIAIIGLSGRYPLAEDLTAFWRNLAAGRDCIREFPQDRWRHPPTFDPAPGTDGATYSKWGGFLDDIDRFDALFFSISPKEAKRIDPQERLFLETVHHTLEDAGYRARDLDPEDGLVGVFVGVMWGHYQLFGVGRPVDKPGANYWSIANRVSYQFDFRGPSLAVDTACSSSLTALHLACESLRHGLCRVAIAGGVNLATHPDKYPALSQARFLSTDGRCRSFGEGGDGYVPGEGVGAALLKPLEAARRDGDRIWGVIRGSALNHDGKTNGYSVPNPDAQSAVISAALRAAGVSAGAVSYIEAHGTGTALGDPIEIAGLTKAFGTDEPKRAGVCAIGSAKASIGHLESAAGIAGVTKVLLQMQHGQLVPSLHADPPNPHIDFDATPFRVQRRLADWSAPGSGDDLEGGAGTRGARRLLAGVSSFGAGGANAHLILESHPPPPPPPDDVAPTGPVLVILSAREAGALRILAGRLRDHVLSDAGRDQRLADIAFTLQVGREPLPHRLAVVADGRQDLAERLERFLAGAGSAGGVHQGEVTSRGGTLPVALDDAAGRAYLRAVMAAGDLGKLATLWLSGVEIDWRGLYGDPAPRRVALPLYPFVRERYWIEDTPALPHALPTSVAAAPEPDGREDHAADAADAAEDAEPGADAPSVRRNTVAYLRSVLASVIDLAPEKIGLDEPFESFGLDSVMILALTTALEARFGTLPKTLFFEVQSLSQLARFLFEHFPATIEAEFGHGQDLKGALPATPPPVARPRPEPAAAPRPDEPIEIAVIGIAGRYPTADSLPAFWHALREGRDCISEIPADRWDHRLHYDPALNRAGASYSKWGGFLDDVACFDPLFFNISPREAERIDPQERLFLETVYHTLEDAGYTAASLDPDRRVGLFVGVTWGLYQMHEADSPDTLPASFFWSVANRASFLFDFQGPSLAVDTACSSSLSALHLACESLRRGESRVAIAGGVNLTVHPNKYIMLGQSQFTSTDGRCRSFGEGGDGYVPGEGVGAVLLKPLAQAIGDRDRIQAVIKATSANHGGKTNGYSVPSPDAQARLIDEALARGQIDPRTISYVEAHGTGTALGDPIEIRGLVKALGRDRPADLPLVIGSAKSNIGHLESAAGIAGVTKVLLQMKHGQIAPSLHSKTLNPYLAFDGAPLHIQQTLTDWTAPAPLRAGVSSFGAGGANSHVILESRREARPPCRAAGPALVPLSAKSSGSLKAAAGNLLAHVRAALAQGRLVPGGDGGPRDQTAAIRAELTRMVAPLLAVEPQDLAPDEPLSAYGLDAVQMAALRQALEQRWPDQVAGGADLLADDPSLDQVGRRLAEAGPAVPGPAADGPPDPDPDLTDLTLADLAYTLQVGRDAMPLRLALVVDSLEALCAGLQAFLDGAARGDLVHGRAQPPAAASGDDLDADAGALAPEVAAALRAYDLHQLARQWVAGQRIDWPQLYGATEPRRIALPLYPFARERYWVPEIATAPLRHRVKSAQELMPDRVGSLAGFQPVWQPRPLPEVPLDGARAVVVVGHEALADRLRADLPGVVSVTDGAAFEPTGPTGFRLPVSDDTAWRHLFQTLADRGLAPHHVVVCCREDRPADQPEPEPATAEATWRFLAPHVALARGLLAVQPESPAQILSLGLFDAPTEAACLAQALAGFGKTLVLETETLSYRSLIVVGDDARVETLAGHLVREFAVTGGEAEVRYRHGTREAKRFQTFPLADTADRPPPPIRRHGVYLITGGAGGIGSLFADALAAQHQARLILIGRSALDDAKRQRLEALRRLGAQEALYLPADITRRDSVTALIAEAKQRFGTVHGILHAAGTILPALITKAEWANVARILAPKVLGTLNLDAATRDEPIDFLLLFSSISGAIGDVGLADYAYANAFLDHFAHYRNQLQRRGQRHGRTLAVNWPAWKDGGMQLPAETRELLFRTWGMIPMPTNEGLEAFRTGLTRDDDHFVVGYGDPVKLERRICKVQPLNLPASGAAGADAAERDQVRGQLAAVLSARIAAILKVPLERIDAAAEMSEYGFESITLTEFANQLNEAFDLDLTPAVFYRYTTLDAVIGFLLDTSFQTIATALAEPQPQATRPAAPAAPTTHDDDDEARRPGPQPAAPAVAEPRVEAARLEPVAIIGMDGILPGSPDLETFWDHLDHGRDLIREIPPARWDVTHTYDPTGRDPTRANTKWAGTIDDVDLFDAKFFKISRREAELMDPQHRLLLEVVWRTVENAGYRIGALAREPVGLFVGAQFQDYQLLIRDALTESSAQTATGNQLSLLVNRVSYLFNFTGPSLAVDTACSGALVALHQAVRSIQLGECATALVGGANLLLAPETLVNTARLGVLSPDGRCKTFDAAADGYVKGEGIVAVLLKPVSRAVADKDTIHAVIAGSAVNHGGRSNSMTAPSPEAQARVIVQACRRAAVAPETIGYIECHGTGTKLGDPVEIEGLKEAFDLLGAPTTDQPFCGLGSVKTNIGHLEPAAGLAGLIKVLLAMRHRRLPATLHLKTPNPFIKLRGSPFYLLDQARPWEPQEDAQGQIIPLRAGVSSFGIGGTNAHVVLEKPPAPARPGAPLPQAGPVLVVLSARDDERLRAYAGRLIAFLERTPVSDLPALAWTLQTGREAMAARLAVVARDADHLLDRLRQFRDDAGPTDGVYRGTVTGAGPAAKEGRDPASVDALARQCALDRLAALWVSGAAVNWSLLHPDDPPARVPLPTYPFARTRFWLAETKGPPSPAGDAHDTVAFVPLWRPAPLPAVRAPESPSSNSQAVGRRYQDRPAVLLLGGERACADRLRRTAPVVQLALDADLSALQDVPAQVAVCFDQATLEVDAGGETSGEAVMARALDAVLAPLLALIQAGAARRHRIQALLIVAACRPGGLGAVVAGALSGLVRTLVLETAVTFGRTVLTPPLPGTDVADLINQELSAAPTGDPEVRYHDGLRQVRAWQEHAWPPAPQPRPVFRDRGVYLITGGLGGVGSLFARYLAEQHRARLLLTGRSTPSDRHTEAMDTLRGFGAEVLYRQGDVADAAAVADWIATLEARWGACHGVIHCAGALADGRFCDQSRAAVARVLAPKVAGTLALDQATRDRPLDFLVLFSSMTALFGNIGQGAYAFANGFMDRFAHWREAERAAGRRHGQTLAVDWPLWAEGGMQVDETVRRKLFAQAGVAPLATEVGIATVIGGLELEAAQLIVVQGTAGTLRPLFSRDGAPAPAAVPAPPAEARPRRGQDLAAKISGAVLETMAEILKLDPKEIAPDDDLSEHGFDSITLTELTNALNSRFGLDLTPAVMFECPTLALLVTALERDHGALMDAHFAAHEGAPEPIVPAAPAPEPAETPAPSPLPPPLPAAGDAPIAIIGMSGILPGSPDLDAFWDNLEQGRDLIGEIPAERWDWRAFDGDPGQDPRKTRVRWGGFIDGIDRLDGLFFGISPKEARLMDPQQRLFLQVVWHTLEDAGVRPSDLAGSATGVFVGVSYRDYQEVIRERITRRESDAGTGNAGAVVANRVSFRLDLRGPSEPVDTACSSSLTAIHRAIESIRHGGCTMAIAGGVHAILDPWMYILLESGGMLAPDGRCKTFDRSADGFGRGEGVGAVLLKPLAQALADGNPVHGVIRGSAINHGGRARSLTSPSPAAQAALIVEAHRNAGISPDTVGYIEAHGTGTSLGDPIEIDGLKKAFATLYADRGLPEPDRPHCAIGSVKTNIGHLEPAAGIAGVLKVLLMMRHRTIPGTVHLKTPNPYIRLDRTPFRLADATRPWTPLGDPAGTPLPRRAGVSSFGFGGSNAHVVLEEFTRDARAGDRSAAPQLILLSARSPERLAAAAAALLSFLTGARRPPIALPALAWTLQSGREAMEERLAVAVSDLDALIAVLGSVARSPDTAVAGVHRGNARRDRTATQALIAGAAGTAFLDVLMRAQDLDKLASLWVTGVAVDWSALHGDGRPSLVSLPTYPFEPKRHWMDPVARETGAAARQAAGAPATPPTPAAADTIVLSRDDRLAQVLPAAHPIDPAAADADRRLAHWVAGRTEMGAVASILHAPDSAVAPTELLAPLRRLLEAAPGGRIHWLVLLPTSRQDRLPTLRDQGEALRQAHPRLQLRVVMVGDREAPERVADRLTVELSPLRRQELEVHYQDDHRRVARFACDGDPYRLAALMAEPAPAADARTSAPPAP